ncbi:MAG: hypothetical protein J0I77_09310 [Rudaea sp.]|uniref:hypothetical protein n=1 Tax=unclassified Rudaea TaxID=2627037 RepID=UPI0014854BB5|nr:MULTISPECIES: hypothetical protein [unclassified Rudaea]MBN8885904.1 hypothetical protein [Rudaea sp.]MBR0346977.1 hypothetical protein [Rudaea sp.]
MLKLSNKKTRFFPVTVDLQNDEGRVRKFTFSAEFNVVSQSAAEDLLRVGSPEVVRDRAICDAVFIGWKDVLDVDGETLEVNEDNRLKLLEELGVQGAIVRAWLKSIGLEAYAKN